MRLFALLTLLPAASFAASCTTTADCTEWITFGKGPARSKVYRTYPLEARNETIRRALVVVHGAGRDADNYFRTAVAAAFLAGALDDTIVIAPRIASNEGRGCTDQLDANEVNWPCGGNSWRAGGISTNQSTLTSFDFADEILKKLARKEIFPNLKSDRVHGPLERAASSPRATRCRARCTTRSESRSRTWSRTRRAMLIWTRRGPPARPVARTTTSGPMASTAAPGTPAKFRTSN